MTNAEKYKLEIMELVREYDYGHPAVVNGKPCSCRNMDCCKCDLDETNCGPSFIRWMYAEYRESNTLTKEQRAFCEFVGPNRYIARDRNSLLFVYTNRPEKDGGIWACKCPSNPLREPFFPDFPFIRWEDEEPYSVQDMLTWEVE